MPGDAVPIDRARPNRGNQDAMNSLRPAVGASLRSSQDVIAGAGAAAALGGLPGMYAPLSYMLPWAALDYIEMVAVYNPDYSQAIDNIITLSNPNWNVFVTGAKRSATQIKSRIEEKSLSVQRSFGGLNGLIDKLLKQAATYGAMCGEWLVSEDLTDVLDFADINPKLIRFFWEDDHWAPYQKVSFFQMQEANKTGQVTRQGNFVKLNEVTFHYYAFNAFPGSPYGVPPFLAALPHISTQQDMLFNMAQVVKKVGMLGVVDIVVEQLNMMPGETPEGFRSRAVAYLEEYATAMEQMMSQGGIAHFDDATVNAKSISGNAAGASAIFKQNEELLFSGLKSMPSVQGRSYSTTETYAGVAYDIIIRNTGRYQSAVKAMMESGFWLMSALWGENPKTIQLNFKPNKTLHRLEEAKAENMEILNNAMLWVLGMLDQQGVAHRMGFNEVATELGKAPTGDPIFGHPSTARSVDGQQGGGGGSSTGDHPPAAGSSAKGEYSEEEIHQLVEEAVEQFMALHPEYARS